MRFNHAPAQIQLQTGFSQLGRPSMGAWLSYGLGSENKRPAQLPRAQLRRHAIGGRLALGERLLAIAAPGRRRAQRQGSRALSRRPRGHEPREGRRRSLDALRDLNRDASRRASATRRRSRAIAAVRDGVSACRARSRASWTSATRSPRRSNATACSPASRPSPPTACSRGASPSRACASSSSTTVAGTSTAPARTTTSCIRCRASANRSTGRSPR
jgi:hypothetical protein